MLPPSVHFLYRPSPSPFPLLPCLSFSFWVSLLSLSVVLTGSSVQFVPSFVGFSRLLPVRPFPPWLGPAYLWSLAPAGAAAWPCLAWPLALPQHRCVRSSQPGSGYGIPLPHSGERRDLRPGSPEVWVDPGSVLWARAAPLSAVTPLSRLHLPSSPTSHRVQDNLREPAIVGPQWMPFFLLYSRGSPLHPHLFTCSTRSVSIH